jgi:hypothetical protein
MPTASCALRRGGTSFFLCPDHALASFEKAAEMGYGIVAYDAAMMRIERGDEADRRAAVVLRSQAVKLGDRKAQDVLQKLGSKGVNASG